MIFVSCGTHEAPFDRLMDAAGQLTAIDGEVVLQHGTSEHIPDGVTAVDYLDYEEMLELMRAARVVVCHAGVGSFLTALTCGKRPVVMPRRHEHGEHVDDHQLELARRLEEHGLVTVAETPEDVVRAATLAEPGAERALAPGGALTAELSEYL